jgi:hypothetical protein
MLVKNYYVLKIVYYIILDIKYYGLEENHKMIGFIIYKMFNTNTIWQI